MRLSFHRATSEDAPRLTAIALRSKAHWGYPPEWMQFWLPQLAVTPESIALQATFRADLESETVGFYVLSAGPLADLNHFWLLPEFIGTGLGLEMFQDLVVRCRSQGIAALRIESDPNAEGFYRHMGCRRVGTVISEMPGQQRHLPILHYTIASP